MGTSWSSSNNNNTNRRRNQNNQYPPSQLISSSTSYTSYPPADPYANHPPHPYPPYQTHQPPMYYYSGGYTAPNYQFPLMGRSNFWYQNHGWVAFRPPVAVHEPAAFVEEQQAKKVRNDVNVHKDTIKLVVDEDHPDHYLVSFVFDAMFDGSITIFYFAKEEPKCEVIPVFPESYKPVKVPFQKGAGQKFRQPSRTGINLGSFGVDDLSKSMADDVFPLIISAETCLPSLSADEQSSDHPPISSPRRQITQAVLEKKDGEPFKVRVIKQILWIDDVRYELREIYGIGNSGEAVSDNDSGKECVICMTERRNTAVLPCRHMCLCSECAKTLRLQSNKCPICRQPIEELMEIKIDNDGSSQGISVHQVIEDLFFTLACKLLSTFGEYQSMKWIIKEVKIKM